MNSQRIRAALLGGLLSLSGAVFGTPAMQSDGFVYREEPLTASALSGRIRERIDLNWRFVLGDPAGIEQPGFDDSGLRLLNLPHDWGIEGEYNAHNPAGGDACYLPGGIGWYRKTVRIPASWRADGRRVTIDFDGVFRNSRVYVNGKLLGERPYGWISFAYDITDALAPDGTAVIAVCADNSLEPAARWYTGSGIYSHVTLQSTAPVRLVRDGFFATTPEVRFDKDGRALSARLHGAAECLNDSAENATLALRLTLRDASGRTVARTVSRSLPAKPGQTVTAETDLCAEAPTLWSPDSPALYRLTAELLSDGVPVDAQTVPYGIRTVRCDAKEGLFLNGKPLKLRGAADHMTLGGLGTAVPENLARFRLMQLKSMGLNAVRTAHNPRAPWFYDLCDELGIVVMNEIFDGWVRRAKHDYATYAFKDWWKRDVADWVRRDRNHPSVFFWSIGNETGYRDVNHITEEVHKYDPTRPTTGGTVAFGVDVAGINGPSEMVGYKHPNPSIPFVATESPHTWSVRGMYRTQTWYRDGFGAGVLETPHLTPKEIFEYDWAPKVGKNRRFQSSYDNAYVRTNARNGWQVTRDTPWRMGEFRWTGYDYHGAVSYISGGFPYRLFTSGAIDSTQIPKDLFYLYQSLWTDPAKAPMVHLLPSWTHPLMKPGTVIPVHVYSNCDSAELFFDGTSLGKQTRGPAAKRSWDKMNFAWDVPWKPGTLRVVAYDAEGRPRAETTVRTAGLPEKLALSTLSAGDMPADPFHTEQVIARLTDASGELYPYGENRVFWKVTGPARLRALDSGNPVNVERHAGVNSRAAFMGYASAYVQATQGTAPVLVTAAAILGETRALTSDRVAVHVAHIALRGRPEIPETEIFYTLDGSAPTRASTRYTGPFRVKQGTTVRATVLADGKELLALHETFAPNLGLHWGKDTVDAGPANAARFMLRPVTGTPGALLGLSPDNTEAHVYATGHVGPYAYWTLSFAAGGSTYLRGRKGKVLAYDGRRLLLQDVPSVHSEWRMKRSAGVTRIRHVVTGRYLTVGPKGDVLMSEAAKAPDAAARWQVVPVK